MPSAAPSWYGQPCMMGIDEAGRGPVLGPMVYACAFCPISQSKDLAKRDFADSKTLTAEKREQIFAQLEGDVSMGYKFHSLAAHIISARMLQRSKVSLNALANEATFGLIDEALGDGINLKQVFVDTVGDAGTHQSRLASRFPGIEFTVCPKADALYPIVSAASIVAKVIRDKQVRELESKLGADAGSFGSGYPADPTTKAWLRNNLDPVFGYPNAVRFSWQTCERLLESEGTTVLWEHDQEDDEHQGKLTFATRGSASCKASSAVSRHAYFRTKRLQRVETLF
ncbi:unnamed protein product [Ostreobium quekettii]|uniref:Ribonuclease n=1 Tax=Ostreobium quekettii TaxID=121088 RepID=A0A8S1ITP8_9CHLO|nr:unnamed protein product [Ostreobium quekettii]